jgi:hypothetical protein
MCNMKYSAAIEINVDIFSSGRWGGGGVKCSAAMWFVKAISGLSFCS